MPYPLSDQVEEPELMSENSELVVATKTEGSDLGEEGIQHHFPPI